MTGLASKICEKAIEKLTEEADEKYAFPSVYQAGSNGYESGVLYIFMFYTTWRGEGAQQPNIVFIHTHFPKLIIDL